MIQNLKHIKYLYLNTNWVLVKIFSTLLLRFIQMLISMEKKMASDIFGDIYKEMGAKPIINAIGSVTLLGGSTPKPIVKEAMDRADSAYVN